MITILVGDDDSVDNDIIADDGVCYDSHILIGHCYNNAYGDYVHNYSNGSCSHSL